ncbi:hypothetical protein GF340_00245 [Candidatus Peregrinibacteria bacterium]|nr:hypothetical protein [Candidatus Peregrinibacteria bacterium]
MNDQLKIPKLKPDEEQNLSEEEKKAFRIFHQGINALHEAGTSLNQRIDEARLATIEAINTLLDYKERQIRKIRKLAYLRKKQKLDDLPEEDTLVRQRNKIVNQTTFKVRMALTLAAYQMKCASRKKK